MRRPILAAGLLAAAASGLLVHLAARAQSATSAPAAVVAGVEPVRTPALNDLEELARTKGALFRAELNAIMVDVMKSPKMAALQKDANDVAARANDALVKAAGKDPKTHVYNFDTRRVIPKPPAEAPPQ